VLRFAFLGSGSRGNALLVESDEARVLIDCGFSATEAARRLEALGREPGSLDAILVTHEHSDHAGGVARLARRFGVPVMSTSGTREAVGDGAGLDDRGLGPVVAGWGDHSAIVVGEPKRCQPAGFRTA
jgi:phosphoribosyl 1,2-cyclic phosphodiesterase